MQLKQKGIGNVGMKPELRMTSNGKPVTNFKVFVNRVYKEKGEPKNDTQTFSIVAFDKLAESCAQYLEQGKHIYVRGPISLKTWQNVDGQFRAGMEVMARAVVFLDPYNGNKGATDVDMPEES